jgi:hypothetical protein
VILLLLHQFALVQSFCQMLLVRFADLENSKLSSILLMCYKLNCKHVRSHSSYALLNFVLPPSPNI